MSWGVGGAERRPGRLTDHEGTVHGERLAGGKRLEEGQGVIVGH